MPIGIKATGITVATLAEEMPDILDRVANRGECFIIERGGKAVARLEPAGPVRGLTLQELVDKLGNLRVPEGFADAIEDLHDAMPPLEAPEWSR